MNCAKYAGPNVHKKLVTLPEYQSQSYFEALKRTFFDVDEDIKARASPCLSRERDVIEVLLIVKLSYSQGN